MKNQKGITLIALIITIIVMLILVAVSVTVALQSGLFSAAGNAASKTKEERENEILTSEGKVTVGETEYNSLNEYVSSLNGGAGSGTTEIAVGDIILGYVPASQYTSSNKYSVPTEYAGCTGEFYTDMGADVEWKVIEVAGNTMKIIPKAVSSTELTISGANGWNNSIDAINGVCGAIYGNTTSDKYTATATGLTVENINTIAGYTPSTSTTTYSPSDYGSNNKFPTEYLDENGITYSTVTSGYATSTSTNKFIKTADYSYKVETQTNFNQKFAGWVDVDKSYWLASRCVSAGSSSAYFEVRWVNPAGNVGNPIVFNSGGGSPAPSIAVRPVVSLTSNVNPVYEKTVGEGETAVNYWKFE